MDQQLRQAAKMDAVRAKMKRSDPFRNDMEEIHGIVARAAELARQLRPVSRRQVAEPIVGELNDVLASADEMIQRIFES